MEFKGNCISCGRDMTVRPYVDWNGHLKMEEPVCSPACADQLRAAEEAEGSPYGPLEIPSDFTTGAFPYFS